MDVFRKGKAYSTVYPTSNPSVTITNLIPVAQVISIEAGEMGISDSHSNKIGKIKKPTTEPLKLKKNPASYINDLKRGTGRRKNKLFQIRGWNSCVYEKSICFLICLGKYATISIS